MNFHYLLKEIGLFLAVIIFFVVPSICTGQRSELILDEWKFPLLQLAMTLCGFAICYIKNKELITIKKSDTVKKLTDLGTAFLSFGMLCTISALLQTVGYFVFKISDNARIVFPSSLIQFLFFILLFLSSAFFEELIFRLYLPEAFKDIFSAEKHTPKLCFLIKELLPCVLFAFCHRYLGWFAVINAFFCHFALRFCYLKTKNFLYGTAVHFLYNILSFFVLCYLN